MTVKELAKFLRCDRQKLYDAIRNGRLKTNRYPYYHTLSKDNVMDYLYQYNPKESVEWIREKI